MKNLKRMTAFILCLVLLFPASAQAYAYAGETKQDASLRTFEKVEQIKSADGTTLLIWLDRSYTQEGGDYSVTVDLLDERTYTVPQDDMLRTVWERTQTTTPGVYPMLFVFLPSEVLSDMLQMRVSAGAFQTSSGEDSPAFRVTQNQFTSGNASIGLRCKATVTGLEKLGYRVVPHTSMTVSCARYGELARFSYDGVPVEGRTVVDVGGEGEHILRAEVAPGVCEQIVLRVDSPAKAYLRSLGQHTVYMMMVPLALLSVLPVGLEALLILPGFAYVALAPVGWSVTAVRAFFQSFASVQGKEYEFHAE